MGLNSYQSEEMFKWVSFLYTGEMALIYWTVFSNLHTPTLKAQHISVRNYKRGGRFLSFNMTS